MGKITTVDTYKQWYWHTMIESTANAGVKELVNTNKTVRDQVGMEIYKISFCIYPMTDMNAWFDDGSAFFTWGLDMTYKQGAIPVNPKIEGVLVWRMEGMHLITKTAEAIAAYPVSLPYEYILTDPVVCLAASCYPWIKGLSAANPFSGFYGIYFKYVDLPDDIYREMIDYLLLKDIV